MSKVPGRYAATSEQWADAIRREERERIMARIVSLKRFDDVEEAQGCGVEPSKDGWLVDYEEVIDAIRGEQA
jgi:hypothetical protein